MGTHSAGWMVLGAALLLGGCASMNSVTSEVSSFGDWPAGKKPGTYAFERLPSQQARAGQTEAVENSARAALQKAGFTAVEAGKEPDVLVQVGARDGLADYQPWNDPLWWRGGFGYGRGPWGGPRWGMTMRTDFPRIEREVAVLIRERSSGKPLFESRASSEGNARADGPMLEAMFEAALMDFPRLGVNPRRVVTEVQGR